MGFEAMFKRWAPYLVGWYAIASITDAMFYSMTGLTFFVGSWQVRAGLTVADLAAAYAVWIFVKRGEGAQSRRTFSLYADAARAVKSYIDFTCAPTPATDPNQLLFNRRYHTDYMNMLESSSGTFYADVFTNALQAEMAKRVGDAVACQTTTNHQLGGL